MKRIVGFLLLFCLLATMSIQPVSAQGGNTYSAGFQVQNLEGTTANITLLFYDFNGTQVASIPDTIPANSNKTYYPLTGVNPGFAGSVVVQSDKKSASIVNLVIGSPIQGGGSYAGFNAPANNVSLPLLMKANYGIGTWFSVQNTTASSMNVSVDYSGGGLGPTQCDETVSVPAYTSKVFDQTTNSCLPNGWVGGAQLSASGGLAAVVVQVKSGAPSVWAYSGFVTKDKIFYVPLFSSNFYRSGSSINVQNTGTVATNVTITYTPNPGFPGNTCTETKTINPGQTVVFGFPQLPAGCGSTTGYGGITDTTNGAFVGSAVVTTNSANQDLVAIVNQVKRGANEGASYNAFYASNATNKISFPLVMDRNYGLFTGMSIINVGSANATVNCTFSGSSRTITQTIAPGAGFTDVHLNQFSSGYVGAAICTAGSSDKIVGILNQAKTGAPDSQDQLFTYEGINY